ncbi:MAG: hypothetical protein GY737_16495 [Desulfobacteraceae bacterium]|nr:hypothetical protein [Desulfobacteraceae bacterium]
MKTLKKHGGRLQMIKRITGYLMLIFAISFGFSRGICTATAESNNGGNISTGQAISTDGLYEKVASILSNYDPSNLTAADARAINDAFREAGVRRGPAQQEAIKAAGFDPHQISSLDPPPDGIRKKGRPGRSE